MKKSNLITGILYVLFGVVCLIVALLIETKLEGILWGFAGAGIFPGIMMIIRLILRVNFKTDIVCVFGVERKCAAIVAKIGDSRDDQDQTENAKKFFLHRWQPP